MLSFAWALALVACGGGGEATTASDVGVTSKTSGVTVNVALQTPASAAVAPAASAAPAAATPVAQATASKAGTLSFSFALVSPRTTSAGVYGADGALVRTLWRGERLPAGSHQREWDQRLDDGTPAVEGSYTVRVIHHDLSYQWDGVVGNTSATSTHAPHRAFMLPQSLAADGLQMHVGVGYNEAQSAIQGFDMRDPQRPASRVSRADPFIGFGLVASDGTRLYAANTGGLSKRGFVVAFDTGSGAQAAFTEGQPWCLARLPDGNCYPPQDYRSVFALRSEGEPVATGLAVQRGGPLLAVAYGAQNLVRLYDKTTGRLRAEWSVPLAAHSANHLAMAANGDLWVVSTKSVLRYTALATQPRLALNINGLDRPLAVAADPADDATVWVADGGASQLLRRFGRDGIAGTVIGQRGGLSGDARVTADRLCFAADTQREHTALAVDGQGQLWVVDTCNNRLLHLSTTGALLDTVAYLPAVYTATVDLNRPERVFANFLEFEVDYTRPLDDGGWRLVRNWLGGLPPSLRDAQSRNGGFGGLRTVHTLSNGRSYGLLSMSDKPVVVELTAAGVLREVQRLPDPPAGRSQWVLHDSGELGYAADEGARQVVYRLRLEGFDAAGNPRWASTPTVVASAPASVVSPVHPMGVFAGPTGPRFPITSSGKVIFFNPGVAGADGFHLGAVNQGSTAWAWQASPSGPLDGRGSFQTRRADPGIQYGGNVAMAAGRSVVYGYHGEFYTDLGNGRVGQANQFMHFHDSGLFVGQFGVASTRGGPAPEPGLSGNAFSPTLVRAGGRIYLYHNDESTWGGVHRWWLKGAEDIVELSATGPQGARLALR
jgi:hypothetical protein